MSIGKWVLLIGSVICVFSLQYLVVKVGELSKENQSLTEQLSQQVDINKDYQARITRLNQLDIKYTQELVSAKNEIDQLRIAAERNPERVYIRASCPKGEGSSTSGLDDGATARPTDSAVRNYWLLRNRIAESEQMIKGLQDYIRTECLQ
ncbi:lysis protein [Providencia vermicola]|uniref:lysis protein n=1 Tax=Providencia TaxID=586 RepID=UPI0019352BCE|nr:MULTISPECIES: lysis protein [Providencia]QPB12626.1 endopeptidase Rz [Providencia phage PSTCR7lys]ELR5142448.1 lysis protein [Providencia stuartii]WER21507.1 lysis protein [Providencia stuartii]WER25627.1 lysis protein [Providencia stuartii]WER29717.1 lysis protein [Providencia stuartii]